MPYPIVKVTTPDSLQLFGFLAESKNKETILVNIHGTAAGFYIEEFEEFFVNALPPKGIATLFTNNRGNFVLESWQKTGAAAEKFEDCLIDIDTWIEFASARGYSKIILQGHSLGTEKIVYYMNKGKHRDNVIGVILLGFSDSYGMQHKFLEGIDTDLMNEAKKLIAEDKGEQFLAGEWLSHAGVLPQNAESYVNFFSEYSELSKALPLRNGKNLEYLQNISVPILGIISDGQEHTVIPTERAIQLLKDESPNATVHQIKGTDHDFSGKQKELIQIVENWIQTKLDM